MAVPVGPVPKAVPAVRVSPGTRTVRKIGFLGSHTATLKHAPWLDQSWELWGHGSAIGYYGRSLDRYFDLHGPERWSMNAKKKGSYLVWLGRNTVPIYMQERYTEIPASIRYPRERILMEYGSPRPYFTNHLAWMLALALSEGVTTIGLFGINYGHSTEYAKQRGCAEYWLGRASALGVHVVLPTECTLLRDPAPLYGYESHDDTGRLVEAYRVPVTDPRGMPKAPTERPAIPPPELADEIAADEAERPEWAKVFMLPTLAQVRVAAKGNGETHGQ